MSQIADHRIERIESGRLTYSYPRTIGRNARLGSHGSGGTMPIVVVRTDSGATGWGIASGPVDDLPKLVGRRLGELFDPAAGVLDAAAVPLDFALHDLAGQLLGVSVHALLGGLGEPSVTCYSGAIYLDDLDPDEAPRGLDAVLENCAADFAAGYRAFKLKIGRGSRWMAPEDGLRRDIEVTRAVRSAYPSVRVLVDANNGYTGRTFLSYFEAVADCDLFWVEEPFQETREDLALLRPVLGSTLAADGEADPDVPFLLGLAREGLLDVLLMDVVSYGFSAWRRLMPTLREIGVRASPHAWGQPLKTLYAAQLAAGVGNVVTVEGVPGSTDELDASGYALVEGVLNVPDQPGFGIPLLTTSLEPVR
jgi:D-galactarolactone cycloisomerase